MGDPSSFGRYYWCVKIPAGLSEEGENDEGVFTDTSELYLYADTCTILQSGALEFRRSVKDENTGAQISCLNLAFAPGEWVCAYEADREDGVAAAVEA